MPTFKIEHVDPNTQHAVAFDVMSGEDVKETFVLRHGEFRLFNMGGGLVLHEISMADLREREREAAEEAELEAEVARERKAKADAEHAEKVRQEREDKKAEIEKATADDAAAATAHDATFGDNWKPEQQKPRDRADPVDQPEQVS